MPGDALARLVADAHGLAVSLDAPGSDLADRASGDPVLPRSADRRRRHRVEDAIEPAALKIRVRELLAELARRVDRELGSTLERAHAWDQVDALRILDRAVDDELAELQQAARLLQGDEEAERRALGLEAQLTLDAAIGLVSLVEKRLATLIRLRLRAGEDPDSHTLLPEGRPFLDLGSALHETARRWT